MINYTAAEKEEMGKALAEKQLQACFLNKVRGKTWQMKD